MFDLNIALKNKKSVQDFFVERGSGSKQNNNLRGVIKAYGLEPIKCNSFPNISYDILLRLEAIGIENTLQLYEEVLTPECRRDFSLKTSISEKEVLKLTKYADLSRIGFLSQAVIYTFVETGFDTMEKLSKSVPKDLYHAIKYFKKEKNNFDVNISEEEIYLIIGISKYMNKEIEY